MRRFGTFVSRAAAAAAISLLVSGCVVRTAVGAAADVVGAGVGAAADAVEAGVDVATPDKNHDDDGV